VFFDESGFMLQPVRRRTWAPSGETPQQYAWDRHDRLSVISALSLSPCRTHIGLYFQIHDHNINAVKVASFLRELHNHLQAPIILVMDRWSVHKAAIRCLQKSGATWLTVELLPAYAPELNPTEAVWDHTKYCDLANFIPDDVDQLHEAVGMSLTEQAHNSYLKHAYFDCAHLTLA
jgi:transposase